MQPASPDGMLSKDLQDLMEKHGFQSCLLAIAQPDHFMLMTCNFSALGMHILGHTLLQEVPKTPPPSQLN